jgi:hypothetical protein
LHDGGRTDTPYPCDIANATCLETPSDNLSFHRWDASLVHILTYTCPTWTSRMLTAKALLTIRRFPIFHHLRSLTGGTVNRFYDHHTRSFPGLDGHDAASPLALRDHRGARKSINLGHYPASGPGSFLRRWCSAPSQPGRGSSGRAAGTARPASSYVPLIYNSQGHGHPFKSDVCGLLSYRLCPPHLAEGFEITPKSTHTTLAHVNDLDPRLTGPLGRSRCTNLMRTDLA